MISTVLWLSLLPLRLTLFPVVGWIVGYVERKLMEHIYSGEIVFSTAWEDPRVDQQALDIQGEEVALIITSAGCNALSLAIDGFKHVYCIDKNPSQNAILELKIAGIRELDYDTFWKMWGEGHLSEFSAKYYPKLRPHLSTSSRQFWDKRPHYFEGGWLRKSFYFYGCSGVLACIIKLYARLIPGLHQALLDLLDAKTLEEQKEIYYSRIEKKMFNPLLMSILSSESALSMLNGVPKSQRDLLAHESGFASVGHFIQFAIERIATTLSTKDNYFYRVYLTGSYTKECCPEYLTASGFATLKKGAVDSISVHTLFVAEFLEQYKTSLGITHYFLLDHMDWMAQAPALMSQEWNALLSHANPEKCRFLWRSASKDAEFVGKTLVKDKDGEVEVRHWLQHHSELAERLHLLDRVHTYTSFFIADLAK